MARKTPVVSKKRKVKDVNVGTFLLVNGKIEELSFKTENTKRGFPTNLPTIKVLSGRKKIEIYKGLSEEKYRVGQSVELKCIIKKVKTSKRMSTKYILV
jgi:hypothetical protein